ncbi:MAG TPA: hypothetical protein VGF70_12770 [Solirubrobacteraceae bacterium]|jgi:hypothetical protein
MARRRIACLGVAVISLALLSATSLASHRATGRLEVLLKPCCSTLPVRPGQPPPHYGPRNVRLQNRAGATVVRKKLPMSHWSTLTAPVGRYDLTAQGCGSARVHLTTHTAPRVKLTCPVP